MHKVYLDRFGKPYQTPYEYSATQKYKVGERYVEHGPLRRVFRYAYSCTAVTAGNLLSAAPFGGSDTAIESICVIPVQAAGHGVVGSRLLDVTLGNAQPADRYAEGILIITNVGGTKVESYAVESNTIGTAAVFTLYDELIATPTPASDTVGLATNPWLAVDNFPAAAVGMPVGIPLIDVPALMWFWCQTWGPVGVYTAPALTIGVDIMDDAGIIGGVISDDAALIGSKPGVAMTAGVATYCAHSYIRIAP